MRDRVTFLEKELAAVRVEKAALKSRLELINYYATNSAMQAQRGFQTGLSARDLIILDRLILGHDLEDVAKWLGIRADALKRKVSQMSRLAGARNRQQLCIAALCSPTTLKAIATAREKVQQVEAAGFKVAFGPRTSKRTRNWDTQIFAQLDQDNAPPQGDPQ